jgi:beta-phosphoglucomutase family hydrolase
MSSLPPPAAKAPRAFIFDMDGTMVDNMDFHAQSWVQLFREIGHEVAFEEFRRVMAGRTTASLLRQYLGGDPSPETIEKYASRKEVLYREIYHPHLKPVPGLPELLRAAREKGIRLAIGSSARKGNIDFVLDGIDVRRFFDVVVGAEDVKHGKPDPEMFLKAADAMKAAPADCWVFEDARAGLDAARAAGMPAVLVAFDEETAALRSHPAVARVIADFKELLPL